MLVALSKRRCCALPSDILVPCVRTLRDIPFLPLVLRSHQPLMHRAAYCDYHGCPSEYFRKLPVIFGKATFQLHHDNTLLSTSNKFRWGTKMFRHEEPKFTTNVTTEPKFQSRCHCTSTYPLSGIWLPLAPPAILILLLMSPPTEK